MAARGRRRFIVPPLLLEQVVRNGDPQDRESALNTLSIDHTLRAVRMEKVLLSAVSPARAERAVGEVAGAPRRTIYDAQHQLDEQATTVLRTEGQPPVSDLSANEAYDGLGQTYRLYWEVYRRDSIDGHSQPLLGEVHYGEAYDNAFWDGERMIFGDGDGRLFTGFTSAVDVIGHELTHGVTESTLNLRYLGQSGALNESISDVFGSLVKQYGLGQSAADADWVLGAGILGPAMPGQGLRSMKAPGTAYQGDPQPSTMSGYVRTRSDNCGVHINSGIPNHAFYLVATAIGGGAWERAGRIWYEVLLRRLVGPDAQFRTFADATVRAAGELFGTGSREAAAVGGAWSQVGVI